MSSIVKQQLRAILGSINEQIAIVAAEAERMNIPANRMRDMNGGWVLIPLIVAKSQVLAALASLEVAK